MVIYSHEYLAPETFGGLNLYAYCGNNPTMHIDPTGQAWYNDWFDFVNTFHGLMNPISKVTAECAILIAIFDGRWNDIVHDWKEGCLNPFNTDESIALKAKVLSFYKGSTVVRHSIPGTTSCQIFGTIFLNTSEKNNADGIEALNHEWGHGVQERILGPYYLLKIAIPSMLYCNFASYDEKTYFSMPWERTADWFGGVTRSTGYKKDSLTWAIVENIFGPTIIPFYFWFGY